MESSNEFNGIVQQFQCPRLTNLPVSIILFANLFHFICQSFSLYLPFFFRKLARKPSLHHQAPLLGLPAFLSPLTSHHSPLKLKQAELAKVEYMTISNRKIQGERIVWDVFFVRIWDAQHEL